MTKQNKKYLAIGGGVLLLLIVIFVFGKQQGKGETEDKNINVTVDITDANGNTETYDPNPLLVKLNRGLKTTYYFDFSKRCDPMEELYNLNPARFMATVQAYKVRYKVSLETHLKAIYYSCDTGVYNENYKELIQARINTLKDIVK